MLTVAHAFAYASFDFRTDVRMMVNPVLTVIVDLVLIGSALWILSAMLTEALGERHPSVGMRRPAARGGTVRHRSPRRARTVRLTVGARRAA
ncbi:MAG: hypothetical protein C4321_02560 [Chloroflexota bacterium]